VEISVSDTGVGIAEHKINDLFNLATQKSTLGTNNETGTGLGLLLVKDAVAMNRGEITVKSKLNKGTTFSFTLPFAEREIHIDL
jgi:signal transduction histidine kinase